MTQDLPHIDTSGIDDLRNIKAEQDTVKQRIEKLSDMKGKVSSQVYDKVFSEYSDKLDELNAQAEPLKDKIRTQYTVLKQIMSELDAEIAAYNLEKEEMELRFTLGEFEQAQFDDSMKKWDAQYTAKQAELEDAQEMKSQFLEVFDSEADLEAGEGLSTIPVAVPVPEVQPPVEETAEPTPEETDDAPAEIEEPMLEEEIDATVDAPQILGQPEEEEDTPIAELPPEVEAEETADVVADEADDDDGLEEIGDDDLVDDLDESLESLDDDAVEMADDLDDEDLEDELDEEDLDDDDELGADFDTDADFATSDFDTDFVTGETEDVEPPPPPLPKLDSELQVDPDAEDETFRGAEPVEDDPAATLMMSQPPPPAGEEEDGTMIISNPKIISLNHATKGQTIVLGMGTTSIGRSPDSDIHLTEDRISRKHSQITFGPGGYAIYDLNSENGTYVNGNRVREHFLSDGDIITVGTYKYQYRDR